MLLNDSVNRNNYEIINEWSFVILAMYHLPKVKVERKYNDRIDRIISLIIFFSFCVSLKKMSIIYDVQKLLEIDTLSRPYPVICHMKFI
jgi:membrane-associated HD superfamily phosphohydrolase